MTVAFGIRSSFGSADSFPGVQRRSMKNSSGTFSPVLVVKRRSMSHRRRLEILFKVEGVFNEVKGCIGLSVGSSWSPKLGFGYWFVAKMFPGVVLGI